MPTTLAPRAAPRPPLAPAPTRSAPRARRRGLLDRLALHVALRLLHYSRREPAAERRRRVDAELAVVLAEREAAAHRLNLATGRVLP